MLGGREETPSPLAPHAFLLSQLVAWLDDRVELPAEQIPQVAGVDPEIAAAACRKLWGIAPDLPIPNLTRVVERAGVVVARAPGGGTAPAGRRHLILVDRGLCPADARLSLAAHLAGLVGVEGPAEAFAAALLLPRQGILGELPRSPSLDFQVLVPLAARWRVGLGALMRRAAGMPIVNAARYRDAADHLGTRRSLPDVPAEPPELIDIALRRLSEGLGIRPEEVARRLGWSPTVLATVTGREAVPRSRGDKVVSLAAWKAARAGAPASSYVQLELDFGTPLRP